MSLTFNKVAMSLFILLSNITFAQSNETELKGFTLEQVPYGFNDENGKTTGLLFEMMNEIILESGLSAAHNTLPPNRLFNELNKTNQACSLLAGTSFIKEQFDLIESIGIRLSAGILPKSGIKLTSYESLQNISIAVPLGIHFHERFDNDESLNKMYPAKYLNAINMIKHNHVDAAAGAISSLLYIAKKEGMSKSDFGKPLNLVGFDIFLTCSRATTQEVRNSLKESTIELREAGRFQEIQSHYLAFDK